MTELDWIVHGPHYNKSKKFLNRHFRVLTSKCIAYQTFQDSLLQNVWLFTHSRVLTWQCVAFQTFQGSHFKMCGLSDILRVFTWKCLAYQTFKGSHMKMCVFLNTFLPFKKTLAYVVNRSHFVSYHYKIPDKTSQLLEIELCL